MKQSSNESSKRHVAKAVGIVAAALAVVALASAILVPTWISWNHDSTMKGFYNQPRNTVQLLFVGTSNAACGFSPDQLYEEQGICSYNLATEQQPLFATLYLIKEAERLHGDSLTTVVLDPSGLFMNQTPEREEAFTMKALTNLRISPVKIEAMLACEKQFDDVSALEELIPLLGYHSRWDELASADLTFADDAGKRAFTRGQHIEFGLSLNNTPITTISLQDKLNSIQTEIGQSESEEERFVRNCAVLSDIALYCGDKGINLVLIRLPRAEIDNKQRETLLEISAELGIDFLDLNTPAARIKMDFNPLTDIFGNNHLNIYGSRKAMVAVGDYLAKCTQLSDLREESRYEFMEEDCSQYSQLVDESKLQVCTNFWVGKRYDCVQECRSTRRNTQSEQDHARKRRAACRKQSRNRIRRKRSLGRQPRHQFRGP